MPSDVRAQPPKQDQGHATDETEGDLPDVTAIIHTLMLHRELITRNQMIYLIVDNRTPDAVPHWPAFAAWWASLPRFTLVLDLRVFTFLSHLGRI